MKHKVCTNCKQPKLINEFSPNRSVKDGHQSNCKSCHNAIAKIYRKTKNGREKYRKNSCRFRKLNRLKLNKRRDEYSKKYPKRIRANNMVYRYIKKGTLTRLKCKICGRNKTVAHHSNYNKPLKVDWLCATHHKEWHKLNRVID